MPQLAAIAPYLAIAATVASTAASVSRSLGQKKAYEEQEAANARWLQYQRDQQRRFDERETANRERATGTFEDVMANATGDARKALVEEESGRLAAEMGDTDDAAAVARSDAVLSGQRGGNAHFNTELARGLAKATDEARDRIRNLAKVSAYGGSFGGMGTAEALRNQDAASTVGLINTARSGDIRSLGRYAAVEPQNIRYEEGFLSKGLDALGGALSLGSSLGTSGMFGGTGAGANLNMGYSPPTFHGQAPVVPWRKV